MKHDESIYTFLWKVVAKHTRLDEFLENIQPAFVQFVPSLKGIEILHFQRETHSAELFSSTNDLTKHLMVHSPFTREQYETFCSLFRMQSVVRLADASDLQKMVLKNFLGSFYSEELLQTLVLFPLFVNQMLEGLVIFLTPQFYYLSQVERNWDAYQSVFIQALENHRRITELETLRKAEEAEKLNLLRKLGRQSLSDRLIGETTGLRQVMERVKLVAQSDLPVLLLGETGTGKELIARLIHQNSPRAKGPIIRVNCGAIPSELIDSQLFGHEKGAFTGASERHIGWFERANGGTLFLDEIGELPLPAQVRLLRILQDGLLERVGGRETVHVDVRIVTATNADLAQLVAERKFREDLFYRISAFPIVLPPLRERKEDIPEMARYFAEKSAQRFSLPVVYPTEEDIQLLCNYHWPGNVRELATVIDRAVILGNGKRLEVAKALGFYNLTDSDGKSRVERLELRQLLPLEEYVKQYIELVLAKTRGKIEGKYGCAEILKIKPNTLRAKMRKLGIDWKKYRDLIE